MKPTNESVRFRSREAELAGALFLPESDGPAPALIVCHGAGEFKENYFEMCGFLAGRGIAALALDMHGHGESGGERFCVRMEEWIEDIRAAIDFLEGRPRIDSKRIAGFGLSSGGTAILEAALAEPRLRALIALDPTVHDSLPRVASWVVRLILWAGMVKLRLTKRTLRIPLAKMSGWKPASDPEVNKRLLNSPRTLEAFMAFPLPGAEQAFFVDTIKRVSRISAPTLVIWGEDDKLDPPETGRLLYEKLTCKKRLEVVPGNGHVGHLDRNRSKVFELTADWVLTTMPAGKPASNGSQSAREVRRLVIEGQAAKRLTPKQKWELLSPFLTEYGGEPLAYATLQQGMEYFIDESGYIAYTTVQHPILSPRPRRITLSQPICAPEHQEKLVRRFLEDNPRATFAQISERFGALLRGMGFKVNCLGYEPELPIQTYNTRGNWKDLDLIKRARNEARREGIVIREETEATLDRHGLDGLSAKWIGSKRINDREIWLYARKPVYEHEEGVRKFVAYDSKGVVVGFAFYDPMYLKGKVYGYSANIVRCDEQRYGRLATAIHMEALDKFRPEGKEVLNLLLAPFAGFERGKYNDDLATRFFFKLCAKYGNGIYNFKGLSFHKSKYRGAERLIYYASNSVMPSNDIYLAFLSADIARGYFATVGQLLWGMLTAGRNGHAD